MKLPNAKLAIVPEAKITRYLLIQRTLPAAARRCFFFALDLRLRRGGNWRKRSCDMRAKMKSSRVRKPATERATRWMARWLHRAVRS